MDIVQRLKNACQGHPHAKISWPHRLLHDAIYEIESLRVLGSVVTKDNLRAIIASSGLSQNDWCRKHELAPRTVRRWLSGETPIPKWLDRYLKPQPRSRTAGTGSTVADEAKS